MTSKLTSKIHNKEKEEKEKIQESHFPCILKWKRSECLVFFNSPKNGICIHPDGKHVKESFCVTME
jgi:hypothetical protein